VCDGEWADRNRFHPPEAALVRILHVLWSLDPLCGGPVEALRQLVRAQIDVCGHEVSVLATTIRTPSSPLGLGEFEERVRSDPMLANAEVHLAKAYGKRRPFRHYAYSPAGRYWLLECMNDTTKRPDVVHIHEVWGYLQAVAASASRRVGTPYILRPAGSLGAVSIRHGYHRLKQWYMKWSLLDNLRKAAVVLATSENEAEQLAQFIDRERIEVIPLGVPIPECDRDTAVEQFYESFPALREARIVIFMGRMHSVKRVPMLVEAIARLREWYPDLVLLIVGQDDGALGDIKGTAQQLGVEDALVFAGFLQGDEKIGAFAAADVAALVSQHENFGISAVEAMAHAVPIVVTPEVAAHVYVDASGGGLTVEGSPDAVAEGIAHILDGRAKAMSRAGQDYVREHLTWRSTAQRLDKLYHKSITTSDGQC